MKNKEKRKEVQFAGVLVKARDTGRVFLMLRCELGTHPLTWALISGGIDDGEEVLDGLKREVMEECQIDPNIIEYELKYEENERDGTFYYYEGFTDTEFIPTLDFENLEWGWFEKDDLPDPLYPSIDKKIEAI
jgi:8-oxo-dGTP pyrophosphatase MutT (NUDIX family)